MTYTHRQIVLRELAVYGRTSYAELRRKYEPRGYTYAGFREAVRRLRRAGLIAPGDRRRYKQPIRSVEAL
jgi:hypothetical protein